MFDREGIIDHLRELDEAIEDWESYVPIEIKEIWFFMPYLSVFRRR